jgi:hypothetical protein
MIFGEEYRAESYMGIIMFLYFGVKKCLACSEIKLLYHPAKKNNPVLV